MYRIISLTLEKYKRIALSEIRKITITPTSNIQLILGTNGCGKSSLLDQLTPLPAEKGDFEKGGSKTIVIESQGRIFTCVSRLNGKDMEHSFSVDGVMLNNESTATVQLELCKKYFNVTPESHALMRGSIKFTQMLPAKRREWLLALCENNYDYALAEFDRLKKRANALGGALEMNTKNLVVETAKIMSEAEEQKLEKEVNELLAELQILQTERAPVDKPSDFHLDARQKALRSLHDVSMRLLRNRVVVPQAYNDGRLERDEWGQPRLVYFKSLDELDQEIQRLKYIVAGREGVLVTKNEQFNKLQRQCDILTKTGAEGLDSLVRKLHETRVAISAKVDRLRLGLVFQDARGALKTLENIELELTDLLRHLPINDDSGGGRRFGRARYEGMQQQMFKLTESMNDTAQYLNRIRAQKDHAEIHLGENKQTCPSCQHSWVIGMSEKQFELLANAVKETEKKYATQTAILTALKKDMDEVEAYFNQYRDVIAYTRNYTALKPFWEHLLGSQALTEAPLEAVTLVQQVKRDLLVSIEIQELEESLAEMDKLRLQAAEVGDAKLDEVRKEIEVLTEELGRLTSELTRVQRSVEEYSEYRRQLNTGLQLGEEVERLYKLAQQSQFDQVEAFRRECILHCLREVENALSLKQESLRAARRQKELVEALQLQVNKNRIQEAAAKTMVKALSPTHGLIAQGLLGFIRAFVGEMNSFINRIWKYPLQVIPTGYDTDNGEQSAELDYKFKMIVERENNIVKEISLGSEGIKEMVDLAFKKIAIKYLNLEDSPLMLDEFGKCFDDEHRVSATEEVRWIMENGNHPQLFMISHYSASYSAFTHAQMCVVDDRNVVLPSGRTYNEHVNIVR